jgi:hypothetical protein
MRAGYRIERTFIGAAIVVVVECLVFPDSARETVRDGVVKGLRKVEQASAGIVDLAASAPNSGGAGVEDLFQLAIQTALGGIEAFEALLSPADNEPTLWRSCFPRAKYESALGSEKRLLRLMRALHQTTRAVVLSEGESAALSPIKVFVQSVVEALSGAAGAWESWDRKGRQIGGASSSSGDAGQSILTAVNCDAFASASLIAAPLMAVRHAALATLMEQRDGVVLAAMEAQHLNAPSLPALPARLGFMAACFVCYEVAGELSVLGEALRDIRGREANSMRQLSKVAYD